MTGLKYYHLLEQFNRYTENNRDLSALLFDLDGTLVNTMDLHFFAYQKIFKELGGDLKINDFYALVGPPASITIPQFAKACGVHISDIFDVQLIHDKKKTALNGILQQNVITVLPAGRLLKEFSEQYEIAVVTSGNALGSREILKSSGLLPYVRTLISSDDVSLGKPDPEPYLLALSALNTPATRSIAFEDHDDGIKSAIYAGLAVIDVRTGELRLDC